MRGSARTARVEASFRAQYDDLDDDTLRQIASGSVPWVQDGAYLFAARRAARAILLARGASDVPAVPAWDPSAVEAPGWVRSLFVGAAIIVMTGAAVASVIWDEVATVDASLACTEAREALALTVPAVRHALVVSDCRLEKGAGPYTEVVMSACVTLTPERLAVLERERSRVELQFVRRFTAMPTPGQHCAEVALADVVEREGRPWFVRLR